MQGLKFLVVGPPEFLSPSVEGAWARAGITLLGPVNIFTVDKDMVAGIEGAIVNILESPEDLFELSLKLEAWHVPFIFALGAEVQTASRSPFFLNGNRMDIRKVVETLLAEGDDGRRH